MKETKKLLGLWLKESEHYALRKAAAEKKIGMSEYVRRLILKEVKRQNRTAMDS